MTNETPHSTETDARKRRARLTGLLAGSALALFLAGKLVLPAGDFDLWGYMAFGRLFWEDPGFPYRDVFAYTPTKVQWVYHEWLTGVLYYPIYYYLGGTGIQGLRLAVGLATCLAVYAAARVRGAMGLQAGLFCLASGAVLPIGFAPARAQIFTYLFFALYLGLLESARRRDRYGRLWLAVLVMPVWANLHGGFLAGLGLTGMYAAGALFGRRRFAPYSLCAAGCAAVTFANPYGLSYWTYLFEAIRMPRPDIAEWFSVPKALTMPGIANNALIFLAFALLAATLLILRRHRDLTDWIVLAVTFQMGFSHLRHQVFFFLAFGALLPSVFAGAGAPDPMAERVVRLAGSRLGVAVMGLLTLLFAVKIGLSRPLLLTAPDAAMTKPGDFGYPVQAARIIRERGLSGRVLPHFNWGEWLSWELYPDLMVAMDGRYETVYPRQVHEAYFQFLNAESDWRDFLNAWPPDMILVAPTDAVSGKLLDEPGWRLVHRDAGSLFFERKR